MDMVSRAVLFASADARMPIGNKPLVLHALDDLIAADIRDVAVVAPAAMADEVQALVDGGTAGGQATIHAIDGECAFLDALGQLPLAAGLDPFVVHLGDSLTHNGLRQAIQGPPIAGNDALALVEKIDSRVKPLGT